MRIFRNVVNTVKKAASDTVKQVKRSGQDVADEASRHKTLLAVGATLAGAGPVAVAIGGAAVGAAKRGGGARDALKGGAEAGAVSAATVAVRAFAGRAVPVLKRAVTSAPSEQVTEAVTRAKTMIEDTRKLAAAPTATIEPAASAVEHASGGEVLNWKREAMDTESSVTAVRPAAVLRADPTTAKRGVAWWVWVALAAAVALVVGLAARGGKRRED
jgi:hypothetical protein